MRQLLALTILSVFSGRQATPAPLEIAASLSGYNLLSPSHRCCAFDLRVTPSGETSLRITSGPGESRREVKRRLASERALGVAKALEDNQFFHLPTEVGATPIDGDLRTLRARRGNGPWHEVRIGESAFGQSTSAVERRAAAAWGAVRALVDIPGSNVP